MEEKQTTKDRLLSFLDENGISKSACERQIGASSGFLSKDTPEFSTDHLRKLSVSFPNLDIMWLIFGDSLPKSPTGDKIENNAGSVTNRSQISSELIQALTDSQNAIIGQLAVKDAQITAQQNVIDSLLAIVKASGLSK